MSDKERLFATPRGVLGKRPRITNNGSSSSSSFTDSGQRPRKNPFEMELIKKLHLPVWSPSVMKCETDTPPQTDWTINQISQLNPSNIEESPSTHQLTDILEPELEDKAQADIKHFFNTFNVPSPIVNYPDSHSSTSLDKCVNTDLSFSVDIPSQVMDFLYSYSSTQEADALMSPALDVSSETHNLLNNSSVLRRKLDFNSDQLEFTFEQDESILKSDDSVIEERRCHGALIMSPCNSTFLPNHPLASTATHMADDDD